MARKFYAEYCPYGTAHNIRNKLYIFATDDLRNGWVSTNPRTRRKVSQEYARVFYQADQLEIREGRPWEKVKAPMLADYPLSGCVTAHYPFTPGIYDNDKRTLWHVCITQFSLFSDAIIEGTECEVVTFVKQSVGRDASFGWQEISRDEWVERYPRLPIQYCTSYEVKGE